MGVEHSLFEATGLRREHWRTTGPIRGIFRAAFRSAGIPYHNPHSLRNSLVLLAYAMCRTPEDLKAWSQNLGHESVMTTLRSYGEVADQRQGEIIRQLATPPRADAARPEEFAKAVAREIMNEIDRRPER